MHRNKCVKNCTVARVASHRVARILEEAAELRQAAEVLCAGQNKILAIQTSIELEKHAENLHLWRCETCPELDASHTAIHLSAL